MMDATLQTPTPQTATWRDWAELSKSRIVVMILLTTATGFLLASNWPPDALLLAQTLIATGLVAAGTNALNQYAEREYDGLMERTRLRPLPSGRLGERQALIVSLGAAVVGAAWLAIAAGWLASALSIVTLLTYLFLYTPLKRVTTWSTLVGSFPGAIPPLIGWAAVQGSLSSVAWTAFGIVFLWQMPHFFAIGWLYREDYARAGFSILAVRDPSGVRTARQSIVYSLLLLAVSVIPWFTGDAGFAYLSGAVLAGLAMIAGAVGFAFEHSRRRAGLLFAASIIYLPVVMALLVFDRI